MYNDDINGEQQYLPNQEAVQQCKSNIISFKAHPVNTTNGRQHLCGIICWTVTISQNIVINVNSKIKVTYCRMV